MIAEGVAAAAGSNARAVQVESEVSMQAGGAKGTSKLNPSDSDFKPGVMKLSCSESMKFKRRNDPLTTPLPAVGNK